MAQYRWNWITKVSSWLLRENKTPMLCCHGYIALSFHKTGQRAYVQKALDGPWEVPVALKPPVRVTAEAAQGELVRIF